MRVRVQFKMLEPVSIKTWGVLVCKSDNDLNGRGMGSLDNFIKAVARGFGEMGIGIQPDPIVIKADDMGRYPDAGRFTQAVTHLLKQARSQLDIVFVIIPRRGAPPSLPPALPACPHHACAERLSDASGM